MVEVEPFESHVADYEEWYEKYPFVFLSEVQAIRELMPAGENITGLEIGAGSGRFSEALGIREGVDPSSSMRKLALKRGVNVIDGEAENLPFRDYSFDFVLIAFCISYFRDIKLAFKEAMRALKPGGSLIVAFIDKNGTIGKYYESKRDKSTFYHSANFYTVDKITEELKNAGFRELQFSQTLFHSLDEIKTIETPQPGFGKGSVVLIKAGKKA